MIDRPTQIAIPTLVRVKPGALDRVGLYLSRFEHRRINLILSQGLPQSIVNRVEQSFELNGIECVHRIEVTEASFEHACDLFQRLSSPTLAVLGLGGGKALDVAKYIAFLVLQRRALMYLNSKDL